VDFDPAHPSSALWETQPGDTVFIKSRLDGEDIVTRGGSTNPKGSPKWVDDTINGDKYKQLILDCVVPAVMAKHPNYELGKTITIQQDGAPAHGALGSNPAVFIAAMNELDLGDSIKLKTQPAQSPDTNVCDLGFFSSWQSDYYRTSPSNCTEMIELVEQCYNNFDTHKLNRIWLSHQSCLNEIINQHGSNDYKIPHLNKSRLERLGELPEVLDVTAEAIPFLSELGEL
jgi:hypothetical protein